MLDYLARFASLSDDACARPWMWRGKDLEVRDAMYRSLEDEQEAAATSRPGGEGAAVLTLAQSAYGDLRGLLVGLPDEVLDQVPRPGEWPLREVLRHIWMTELNYRRRVQYALDHKDGQTTYPGVRADLPLKGGIAAALSSLGRARADTDRALAGIPPGRMRRPTFWAGYAVDVRFRLHRFGGHMAEHVIQCEKTLAGLGITSGEARQITRQISAMRGRHEHVSDRTILRQLDSVHRKRAHEVLVASAR